MIHLHRHDCDSVLDGIGTALQGAELAASLGQSAIAQTNHGTLSGSLKHIKACEKVGILPICGIETYWRPNRLVREKEWRYRRWHLILLAKNLRGWHNLIRISSAAYCVTPETKILRRDLKWVEARELAVGDELIGFDDEATPVGRRIKSSKVLVAKPIKQKVCKIVLKNGQILRSSVDHKWLTKNGGIDNKIQWRTTLELAEKWEAERHGSKRKCPKLVKYFDTWDTQRSYDDGYLAGVLDSEGTLFSRKAKTGKRNNSMCMTLYQKPNFTLDKCKNILENRNIPFFISETQDTHALKIGGKEAAMKCMGSFGANRLLGRFNKYLDNEEVGLLKASEYLDIKEIIYEGEQEVVGLETDTHTYLAEGFGAHNSEGFYQSPCVDFELLEKYSDGVICSTSCVLGPLSFLIQNGTQSEMDDWVTTASRIFGDNLYFSIMPHDFDAQRQVNLEIISMANRFGCPIVYEGDSHYPYKGWVETQKIAILIGTNSSYEQAEQKNKERRDKGEEIYELWHDGLHLMEEAEVRATFTSNHPGISSQIIDEAIRNTEHIGSKIEPFLMDRTTKMPRVGTNNDPIEPELEVTKWCREGMERVGKAGDPPYERRLAYELEVIKKRGNFDYFYITGDWVRWAKSNDPLPGNEICKKPMRIGSGRGSVAGSLVSYLCGITTVDPITHKFKFERFLNPERKGLPDIDIDFPSSRRAEAKLYPAKKYGGNSIADVMAQQHFQPRAALKSVTKAIYGFDHEAYKKISEICHEDSGLIDAVHDSNLPELVERIPELAEWAGKYPKAWEQAIRFENEGDPWVMRLSKHAGGVVITPGEITEFMPTIRADESEVGFRTAWSETPRLSIVDDFGFVKWDALGIAGMDQQQNICDLIEKRTGNKIDLDQLPPLYDPYDVEPEVMEAFQEGLTLGVNQLSGEHITSFLKKAQPQNIVDLTAINALYRPGPMGANGHINYANRKNGYQEYTIPDLLEDTLRDTHGSICFQEQVMGLFEILADYTAGQSDGIRKIIAKLYREKGPIADEALNNHKAIFLERAGKKIGLDEAERFWQEILPYTDYSFNRAHAGGYMIQAYQDMWLKVHYPLESYAVIMTMEPSKSMRAIKEARYFDIRILPPDINISDQSYTPDFDSNAIRYGMAGIKHIGDEAAAFVMKNRPYGSMEEFEKKTKIKYSKCNKGHRTHLLSVGALDSLGGRADWSDTEKAEAELELLGMSLTPGGTLGPDEPLIMQHVHSEAEYKELEKGDDVVLGGVITEVKKIKTKRGANPGQEMCFLKIALGMDSFQCTVFPAIFSANKHLLKPGEKLMVKGNKDDRGTIAKAFITIDKFVNQIKEEELVAA